MSWQHLGFSTDFVVLCPVCDQLGSVVEAQVADEYAADMGMRSLGETHWRETGHSVELIRAERAVEVYDG